MKPLVVRPEKSREQSPVERKEQPKPPARPGKTGEGARSALEQLIRQERARVLNNPGEPDKQPLPQ
jgi:hypothetical protein